MSQEVIQGVVYRTRLLLRLSQAVEIIEHLGAASIEIEIQLPTTAELKQVQTYSPPNKKSLIVDDQRQKAAIGHAIQPLIELWPEVAEGSRERLAEAYNRPFRRFRSSAWLRTKARLS